MTRDWGDVENDGGEMGWVWRDTGKVERGERNDAQFLLNTPLNLNLGESMRALSWEHLNQTFMSLSLSKQRKWNVFHSRSLTS